MEEKNPTYAFLGNMRYIARRTREFLPSLLAWVALSIGIDVAMPLLAMYIPKLVIDEITNGRSWTRLAAVTLAATVSLAILGALAKLCERSVYDGKNRVGLRYLRELSMKALTTDYANRETERFRTLQEESYQMCQSNESVLRNIYIVWIGFFASALGFAVYAAVLTRLTPVILLFLAATTGASYAIGLRVAKWSASHNAERTRYHHKLGYIDAAAEDLKSAKDIRLYGIEKWLQNVYENTIEAIALWYKRYDAQVFKTALANAAIAVLREGAAYAYLIHLVMARQIGIGDFVWYFAAIAGFSGWLSGVMERLTEMQRTSLYVSKFRSFLDYPETFQREGGVSTRDMLRAPRRIELRHVGYRYLGAERDTLQDVNLVIEPGAHIGVVGLNGAGKTTLVKLICGLIDPTQGEILYDGLDRRAYHRVEYYRLFSAVFQQYSLLALSVGEIVAENRLYEQYHEITAGKSSLFISHRLASTRFCDTVILIDDGGIAEIGTHEALLRREGLYRALFDTQAKYYRESAEEGAASDEERR